MVPKRNMTMVLRLIYHWLEGRYGNDRSESKPTNTDVRSRTDRSSDSGFEEAHRKLEEMAQLLKKRDPTQYHVELELIAILKQLTSDHQAHFQLNAHMWGRTEPKIYRETVQALSRLLGDGGTLLDQIDQKLERPSDSSHDKACLNKRKVQELRRLIEGEYNIRCKYRELLRLMLNERSVTYRLISRQLNIQESRARGLVSEFENLAFGFDRAKQGRLTLLSIPPSRLQAVRDIIC